jgi:signal transduction histidine kinase/CheY-like chemotaxis protein
MIQSIAHTLASALLVIKSDADRRAACHERLMLWFVSKVGGLQAEWTWFSRYTAAVAALAVATVVRLLLDPVLENRAPYGMYLMAVLFVVWRAGLGPALATVAGGTLLGRYLFDEPRGTLALVTEANLTSLVMSLTIGILAAVVCESLRITARDNRRLYELSHQADARKDEFLATLAHELRNPLMPIRNAVYLLERTEGRESRVEDLRDVIGRHTEHLIRLVNDLLDVSRITQRKIGLKFQQTELQMVIAGAVEVVRPLTTERRQELHVAMPDDPVKMHADPVRLTQVVTNLLHNAAKYTSNEGRIWLSVEVYGNQLVISVRDTGIGLAPEQCRQIFELFQQVHQGIEHSQGGLGVGLTLVRALVELHGGTVEATSQGLGLGSEFTVRMPVVIPIHEEPAPAVPEKLVSLPAGATLRVLVVDDSPAVARSLEMVLTDWNYTVETCADGFAALEVVRTFKPHVVLADLGMPRMNGYQLAEQLRRLPITRDVELIAVSGYGQPADQQRSASVGFSRHLVKPIDLTELKQILATCASRNN